MQFGASKLSSWRTWTNERMWLFLCDLTNPTFASTLSLQAVFSANLFVGRRCFATLYPVLPCRLLSYPPPPSLRPLSKAANDPGTAATLDLALTSPLDAKQTTLGSTATYSLRASWQLFVALLLAYPSHRSYGLPASSPSKPLTAQQGRRRSFRLLLSTLNVNNSTAAAGSHSHAPAAAALFGLFSLAQSVSRPYCMHTDMHKHARTRTYTH